MYTVDIIVEDQRLKESKKAKAKVEADERKEAIEKTAETIEALVKENGFKNPIAEYALSRDGMYIDGECDLKVKVNRNGVNVSLGELII